jgi:hypothetical protein
MDRDLSNISNSANLNDQIVLKDNLNYLVAENKILKEKLEKYEPTYNIEFDYDDRQIELQIKQLGKLKTITLSKADIDLSLLDNGHAMVLQATDELSEIYKNFLYVHFKKEIDKILTNVQQLKDNKLW